MNILFIENHETFFKVVSEQFLKDYDITNVKTILRAKQELDSRLYDIVLIDYDLDDGKGVEVVDYIKTINIDTNVVAVSSHDKGNSLLMAAGADAICSKMKFMNINSTIEKIYNQNMLQKRKALLEKDQAKFFSP